MTEPLRSVDRVRAAAEAAGLPIAIREMPQSTRTAEEAAAACGTSVAQIVKSLVFRKAGTVEPVLLLVSGKNRVDEKAVAGTIGHELERMDARAVREFTGFAIGGVAPIGSLAPLATFMDAELLDHPTVWAAAGAPNAVFEAEPRALAQAAGARIIRLG
jgi:prolyl-tRNA editing enzyme YbaK/EbsC (Cys-tRNA(Pro) deacylase)